MIVLCATAMSAVRIGQGRPYHDTDELGSPVVEEPSRQPLSLEHRIPTRTAHRAVAHRLQPADFCIDILILLRMGVSLPLASTSELTADAAP